MTMDLAALCEHWQFREIRQLEDGTIAGLGDLTTTRAIYLDVSQWGFERRFCFKDRARASEEFDKLRTSDDEPTGWVARRPEQPCDFEAKNTPGYLGGDPKLPTSWKTWPPTPR